MIKTLDYQQKAVKSLVDNVKSSLSWVGSRHSVVFKAPTGSGKTIMAAEMLSRLSDELREDPSSPCFEAAYIWIAPNKLHEQSYLKFRDFFRESLRLTPVVYDSIDHSPDGYIKPGEIFFVNWESINRDNALMIRDTEASASLYDITRRTQEEHNTPIIAIIDEEHLFSGRAAKQSTRVLTGINPKVEVRISATPLPESLNVASAIVSVSRNEVISAQMIKKGVVINPDLDFSTHLSSLNQQLVHLALKKREDLARTYKKEGRGINPLLLIQLPNDDTAVMTSEDTNIKEEVISYLASVGISTANGRLAIWLSNEKTDNLQHISENDDLTQVLLFKQAIAKGWDCPRAAVLLIFRKIESYTFTIQTVGRILRMPEQQHYTDDTLNYGYVYTNLNKDMIEIVRDEMQYLQNYYARRRDGLNNVSLPSAYSERKSSDRNRLGPDFKEVLINTFRDEWLIENIHPMLFSISEMEGLEEEQEEKTKGPQSQAYLNRERAINEKGIIFNVSKIEINIIEDVNITAELGTTLVKDKAKYARTMNELNTTFTLYCKERIGTKFESLSIAVLTNYLKEVMEELFELFESDAIKVILYYANRPKFTDVIDKALDRYLKKLKERQEKARERDFKDYKWEVPEGRAYNGDVHVVVQEAQNHALLPFVQYKYASSPEKAFEKYLEANSANIDWWYKNGDNGKQHYSIKYKTESGGSALFYVDFVLRMKNGTILLFDTKSVGSDPNAVNKHNALVEYMEKQSKDGMLIGGGIIIHDGENWRYCKYKINNTTDITGWACFYPTDYTA